MLWTKLNINITRKTNEIDSNNDYIENIVYSDLEANMIEVKDNEFSSDISQGEPKQKFAFMISEDKTDVRMWDNIKYSDAFWEVKLKVITRPKMIEFEESDNFIKLIAELIWV